LRRSVINSVVEEVVLSRDLAVIANLDMLGGNGRQRSMARRQAALVGLSIAVERFLRSPKILVRLSIRWLRRRLPPSRSVKGSGDARKTGTRRRIKKRTRTRTRIGKPIAIINVAAFLWDPMRTRRVRPYAT
jgi:hypothetical protein